MLWLAAREVLAGYDLNEPYNAFDWRLITCGWATTIAFGQLLRVVRRADRTLRVDANALLAALGVGALIVFAWRVDCALTMLPALLASRVYDGTRVRSCLLIFWSLNVFATIGFCVRTALYAPAINTTHRKFFHVTVSLVAVSGFLYDVAFVILCGNAMLQLFIILEIFRAHHVQPWAAHLDTFLLPYLDEQDSRELILTPIHLIAGIFAPSALELFAGGGAGTTSGALAATLPRYFAGVVTVGVGDAAAALVGRRFGSHRWACGAGHKTLEGSAAMFVAQLAAHALLLDGVAATLCAPTVLIVYALTTAAEASLTRGDNLALPAIGYAAFRLFDLMVGV